MKKIYNNLPEEMVTTIFSYYDPYEKNTRRLMLQMKYSCYSYRLKKSLDHHDLTFHEYMFNVSKNCKRYICFDTSHQ